jgi:predicted DNA binding CopG/RHH family protein
MMEGQDSCGLVTGSRFLIVVTTLLGMRPRVMTAFPAPKTLVQWWYDHPEEVTKTFEDATARGELRTGSAAKRVRQHATGVIPTTTIRLDPQDISRARALAARRGIRYQTYVKMLLHEALAAEEKKARELRGCHA